MSAPVNCHAKTFELRDALATFIGDTLDNEGIATNREQDVALAEEFIREGWVAQNPADPKPPFASGGLVPRGGASVVGVSGGLADAVSLPLHRSVVDNPRLGVA